MGVNKVTISRRTGLYARDIAQDVVQSLQRTLRCPTRTEVVSVQFNTLRLTRSWCWTLVDHGTEQFKDDGDKDVSPLPWPYIAVGV